MSGQLGAIKWIVVVSFDWGRQTIRERVTTHLPEEKVGKAVHARGANEYVERRRVDRVEIQLNHFRGDLPVGRQLHHRQRATTDDGFRSALL